MLPASPTPEHRYAILLDRLLDNRDWPRALEAAHSWLTEDPLSLPAHYGAARALVNLGRDAEAQPHLQAVFKQNPDHAPAHQISALMHFHLQRFSEADKHIQKALELQPSHYGHWQFLTWMTYRNGKLKEAARHARRTLELRPDDPYTLNLLALCQPQDHPAQLALYQRALELDPENSAVHRNLGHYYLWVERDFAAAEASLRRALHFDPTDKQAQQKLFLALQHRHLVYKLLRLPWSLMDKVSPKPQVRSLVFLLVVGGLWLAYRQGFWYLLLGWLLFVLPVQRFYEYLTLGDIRAEAGMIGARRGGLLGYRRWPLEVRLGILAVLTPLFWGALYGASRWARANPDTGAVVVVGTLALIGAARGIRATLIGFIRLVRHLRRGKGSPPQETADTHRKNFTGR